MEISLRKEGLPVPSDGICRGLQATRSAVCVFKPRIVATNFDRFGLTENFWTSILSFCIVLCKSK
jgi:hypothetical protein